MLTENNPHAQAFPGYFPFNIMQINTINDISIYKYLPTHFYKDPNFCLTRFYQFASICEVIVLT